MDRSMTRYRHDINKMIENNDISTGPGRWSLGVPNAYGNAAYITEPTIRLQKWGASHDMSTIKTDVESDLWNLARPTTKVVCGQYSPEQGVRNLTPMKEASFPEVHARLVDPPCTGRASGWNRWDWLYENPQENVSIPFEWALDTRHANKDSERPEIFTYLNKAPRPVPAGVPVPRQPVAGDVKDFSNTIPGASQRQDVVPAYREKPQGYPAQGGNPVAPPFEPSTTEKERATTGRITTPQWFS
jgi:hypothetical protein